MSRWSGSRLARRFDERPRRERIVWTLALCALAIVVADQAWFTPAFQRWRAADQQQLQAAGALATLQAELTRVQGVGTAQEQLLTDELAQWKQRVGTQSQALREWQATLVAPAQMVEVLEQMLPRHGRLRVRSLQSLGVSDALAGAAPAAATAASVSVGAAASKGDAPALYRHGLELVVEGSWADLTAWLQALESMPQRVMWGGLSLRVEQHPKAVLTLRLYTLSLERGWLEI